MKASTATSQNVENTILRVLFASEIKKVDFMSISFFITDTDSVTMLEVTKI